MRPILKRVSILCAGALLLACATVDKPALPVASAEESYLVGRTHHMAQHWAQAQAYYEAALRAAPAHVNARNGLAALYAERGQLDKAIPVWEALAAGARGRDNAYLWSNLGHAYLLRGSYQQAQAALERACVDDPLNARAWEHLGAALAQLGQQERARAMLEQAAALRSHDLKSDYAVAGSAAQPALAQALGAGAGAASPDPWPRTEISQAPGGIFVLRRVEPAAPATLAAAPANFPGNVLLEISNGNGVTGMARSVSRDVADGNKHAIRLTNQKGFAVKRTRVEYKLAFRGEAEQLAGRFGGAQVVRVGEAARADVRLVLGRDLVKPVRPALAGAGKAGADNS